jgi:hypothetical protein
MGKWLGFVFLLLLLAVDPTASAQDTENIFDFWLAESFVHELAEKNTIIFRMTLSMDHRTSKVHTLKDDCEIHIAASSTRILAWPAAVVVEPPNLCKERASGMPKQSSERRLREVLWPEYLDRHVMDRKCDVFGFPRIFTEHAAGNEDPANPNHILEIHPALRITCGSFDLNIHSFLKIYPGMRKIQAQTAAKCVEGRQLRVRKRQSRYEFRQEGGGSCGNFAVFQATINPDWVRKIRGGHSAIARVSPAGLGQYTLKIYTYEGTPEDNTLRHIRQGANPNRRLYFHGMFTYDYFSIVRTVRDQNGTWLDVPTWTRVQFPMALVVFGETTLTESEQ